MVAVPNQYLTAISVALVAVAIGCFAAVYDFSTSKFGELCFEVLGADVVRNVVPPVFSRYTVGASSDEAQWVRITWAVVVGAAAQVNEELRVQGYLFDFSLLIGVQAASYLFMLQVPGGRFAKFSMSLVGTLLAIFITRYGFFVEVLQLLACSVFGMIGYSVASYWEIRQGFLVGGGLGLIAGIAFVLFWARPIVMYLMPLGELAEAFNVLSNFVAEERLRRLLVDLFVVTANIQVPLGFLGIAFLRSAQRRSNSLLAVGEGKLSARGFVHVVARYLLMVALPYMVQRTLLESVNAYAYGKFSFELEQVLRVDNILPAEKGAQALLAAVAGTNVTVSSHAEAFTSVVTLSFSTVERKLFSLPKLALLPGMLWSKPWLVATVLPVSIALDMGKSQLVAVLLNYIETYSRQIQDLSNRRTQVEQHDTKHEELIRRGGAAHIAREQWRTLSQQISDMQLRHDALSSVRGFIEWLYWQDFMTPGIECSLGFLLEAGLISNVDIGVYIRVVEDAIDFLLTRSRMQAGLASMQTNLQRLRELSSSLVRARGRSKARCQIEPNSRELRLSSVEYKRGSSLQVKIPELSLSMGRIYAMTGANGCGKSTSFGILAGCSRLGPRLPPGTEVDPESRVIVPSDDIVEITQQLYCPLFTSPLVWLLQRSEKDMPSAAKLQQYEERIANLSSEMRFRIDGNRSSASDAGLEAAELHTEHEDWYSSLSGGQRIKAELIAKVFLRESCPDVLLLDEPFAALDPASKDAVQRLLKRFCANSLMLIIYHSTSRCVSGDDFFDDVLHFENGTARLVGIC